MDFDIRLVRVSQSCAFSRRFFDENCVSSERFIFKCYIIVIVANECAETFVGASLIGFARTLIESTRRSCLIKNG